jgi:hypothetical protein
VSELQRRLPQDEPVGEAHEESRRGESAHLQSVQQGVFQIQPLEEAHDVAFGRSTVLVRRLREEVLAERSLAATRQVARQEAGVSVRHCLKTFNRADQLAKHKVSKHNVGEKVGRGRVRRGKACEEGLFIISLLSVVQTKSS